MTTSDDAETSAGTGAAPPGGPSVLAHMGLEAGHLVHGLDMAARMQREGDGEGALRTYATLVLCDPMEPRFHIGLATCALQMGLHAVARQAASAAIATGADRPEGYHLHAHASVGLADHASAVDDFTEALRLARQAGHLEIIRDSEQMLARLTRTRPAGARGRRHLSIAASA